MTRRVRSLFVVLIYGLFLTIPPARVSAQSTSLVIYQLQTGATVSPSPVEYIRIYNNSLDDVDVTDWCITKSGSTDNYKSRLGCLTSPLPTVRLMLPSYGSITLATEEFKTANPEFVPDITFSVHIAEGAGNIRILDSAKQEIDRLGWGPAKSPDGIVTIAHGLGKILQRQILSGYELKDTDNNFVDFTESTLSVLPSVSIYDQEVLVDLCPNINDMQTEIPAGYLLDTTGDCQQDVCPNLDGLQLDIPDGYQIALNDDCELLPLEGATLILSELLPNVTSYDTGKEYIEIYNPNSMSINLKGYLIQIGPSYSKSYPLPIDQTILPDSYMAFSDTITGLVLSNTSTQLRLVAPNGAIVSETDTYVSPADNIAWALINTNWQYTNQPTPSAPNVASLEETQFVDEEVNLLGPCPVGQYRSLETNRCRLIQPAVSQLTPCKEGQERNPETNRCRSVLASSSSLVPCKAGQERNPETNRCRSVLASSSSLVPCKAGQARNPETNRCRAVSSSSLVPCAVGQERNPETNRCRKVAGTVASAATANIQDVSAGEIIKNPRWWLAGIAMFLALGYALYEWRNDLKNLLIKRKIQKSQKPPL